MPLLIDVFSYHSCRPSSMFITEFASFLIVPVRGSHPLLSLLLILLLSLTDRQRCRQPNRELCPGTQSLLTASCKMYVKISGRTTGFRISVESG